MAEIKKLNVEKHMLALTKKFDISDIKFSDTTVTFCFKRKHRKEIEIYFKSRHIDIISMKNYGALSNLISLQRIGILSALSICAFLWLFSNFFVTKIIVYGADRFRVQELTKIIQSMYSEDIILKSKVDTSEIEQKILQETQINLVSCVIKGSSIIVNIKEELSNQTYVEGIFNPIISLYDGQVTKMNVTQGTPVVEVGQIVKLGDVLVEPYVFDASGEKRYIQPIADIVCDIWITSRLEVYDEKQVFEKTGKKIESRSLCVFDKEIYNQNNANVFETSVESEKEENITNFLLPIKMKIKIFEETIKVTKRIDFEHEKQKYIENCREIAFLNVREYDIIKEENQTIIDEDGKHTIICVFTISKKVC